MWVPDSSADRFLEQLNNVHLLTLSTPVEEDDSLLGAYSIEGGLVEEEN
jgi:hypothetical protein